MTKQDVILKIQDVLSSECANPAEEISKLGRALTSIGAALQGMSVAEARATIAAVSALSDVEHPEPSAQQ